MTRPGVVANEVSYSQLNSREIEALPSTGGQDLGLTTEETEIVWGSEGGAAEMETFFFLAALEDDSPGLFLFFSVDSAIVGAKVCAVS